MRTITASTVIAVCGAMALLSCAGPEAGQTAPERQEWRLHRTFEPRTWDRMTAVVAVSADDIWAFRSWAPDFMEWLPAAYHWDGRQWSHEALPEGLRGQINSVAARSATDVWATVNGDPELGGDSAVLHFDGKRWTVSKKIQKSLGMYHVVVAGDRQVLAFENFSGDAYTWRYDGRTWERRKDLPFAHVAGSSPEAVWAVGDDGEIYRRWKDSWKRQDLGEAVPEQSACGQESPCSEVVWKGILPTGSGTTWAYGLVRSGGDKEADPVETGLLLRGDGDSWERIPLAANWIPELVAADGAGGLWLTGRQLDLPVEEHDSHLTVTRHRSENGKWSDLPALITPDGPGAFRDLTAVPETGGIIGVGKILLSAPESSDDQPMKAAIWTFPDREAP